MAKIVQKIDSDTHIIHEANKFSPDVVASKLANDPVYGTLVSDDVKQTKTAIVYLYMFLCLPFLLVVFDLRDKFGTIGLIGGAFGIVIGIAFGWRGALGLLLINAAYWLIFF